MILTDGTPSISAVVTCQSPDDEVSTVADSLIFSINVSLKYSLPLRAFSSASCKSCETVAREIISLMLARRLDRGRGRIEHGENLIRLPRKTQIGLKFVRF